MAKAIYIGAFLTNEAREKLLCFWRNTFGPLHQKAFAHHCTIAFRPTPEQLTDPSIGHAGHVTIISAVADLKAQAVGVIGATSNNEYPHITISCAEGISPVYSNKLMAFATPIENGITLQTKVGIFYSDGRISYGD